VISLDNTTSNDTIIIASDHGGYALKSSIIQHLSKKGHHIQDLGPFNRDSVDYPDYAHELSKHIRSGIKGILICGTGIGMSITANRYDHISAALCHNIYTAQMSRAHNDANVLCLGARVIPEETAMAIVDTWLDTHFSEDARHRRRVDKTKRQTPRIVEKFLQP
jgi:ribose 5-phosphate isomerase B